MPPALRPDQELVPVAWPDPGAGARPESTTSTGPPPVVPPPGLGHRPRPPPQQQQTPPLPIPAADAPGSPDPAHARPPTATIQSPPRTPQPHPAGFQLLARTGPTPGPRRHAFQVMQLPPPHPPDIPRGPGPGLPAAWSAQTGPA